MSRLRVSVVIPAYRAARTIGRAVESVLRQSYAAHEILVVDDGSPDNLVPAVTAYGEQVTLIRKDNGGAASARNLGIERATGELIAFLDADDYWEPQKLARHVALYERHPELGLTCSRFFEEQPGEARHARPLTGNVRCDTTLSPSGPAAFELALSVWTGTVVVRRSLLERERFVSGLEPAEDRHLWVRLVSIAPMFYLSEPLATAVWEPDSLSRSSVQRDCTSMLRVVQEFKDMLGRRQTRYWTSHTYYRWAACDNDAVSALRWLVWSLLKWPIPYGRQDVSAPFARAKLLAVRLKQLAKRKAVEGGGMACSARVGVR
jgi:glycosyltransferase involved in cell wall biosynthesis